MLIKIHFLSLLPKVFGPIFNIRCCWKPLTYKILSGLLQCILVCFLFIQMKYEMQVFLPMCSKGYFLLIIDSLTPTEQDNSWEWYTSFL